MYYIITNGKKYLANPRLDNCEFCFTSNILEANIYNDYEYANNRVNAINKRNFQNDFKNFYIKKLII